MGVVEVVGVVRLKPMVPTEAKCRMQQVWSIRAFGEEL